MRFAFSISTTTSARWSSRASSTWDTRGPLLSLAGAVQSATAAEVVRRGLSARETEKLVRSKVKREHPPERAPRDPDVVRLENELADRLGAKVRIDHRTRGRGSLTIHYASLDALDGILERIR